MSSQPGSVRAITFASLKQTNMNMKQLLFVAAVCGGTSLVAQDLAPGINYSYNPPASDGIITDITVDVVNNDNNSAGSFDVSMYLYDQATQNYWIIGTTNIPSLSGNSLITISNWDIDINDTPGIPGGTYRLGIWVDSDEDVSESDENNNAGLLSGNIVYSATAIGDNAVDAASVTVFPNPSSIVTTLNYTLTEESSISIAVFDALGNKVENLQNQSDFGPGSYTQTINTENYANGIYFVTITSGVTQVTRRISVVH
jgi:hypothetical protein